ncbi:MAG TPA: type II toxin-antitoxin system VapC family toxin [Bryobacteraceae bacterium]|nr:type II toxin-antitoxin system VapC family toxin [Bryobacteraceae bacterium]
MIVLDTNVVSELARSSPSRIVQRWLSQQPVFELYISAVTKAEIWYGIESLPEGRRKSQLAEDIRKIFEIGFPGQGLPFDEDAAREYSRIVAESKRLGRSLSQLDAMIAATAKSRGAILATRDADFGHSGIRLIIPWDE